MGHAPGHAFALAAIVVASLLVACDAGVPRPSAPGIHSAPGEPATSRPASPPATSGSPSGIATAPPSSACIPTDQDQYVYNPARLVVRAACIRVTGTVEETRHEADGDLHILIALDLPYTNLLTPANQGEELGDLVVEPVCVDPVSQRDAVASCARDHDPLGTLPAAGMHIWLEGRSVTDSDHGGWAELHPLYRWGEPWR